MEQVVSDSDHEQEALHIHLSRFLVLSGDSSDDPENTTNINNALAHAAPTTVHMDIPPTALFPEQGGQGEHDLQLQGGQGEHDLQEGQEAQSTSDSDEDMIDIQVSSVSVQNYYIRYNLMELCEYVRGMMEGEHDTEMFSSLEELTENEWNAVLYVAVSEDDHLPFLQSLLSLSEFPLQLPQHEHVLHWALSNHSAAIARYLIDQHQVPASEDDEALIQAIESDLTSSDEDEFHVSE